MRIASKRRRPSSSLYKRQIFIKSPETLSHFGANEARGFSAGRPNCSVTELFRMAAPYNTTELFDDCFQMTAGNPGVATAQTAFCNKLKAILDYHDTRAAALQTGVDSKASQAMRRERLNMALCRCRPTTSQVSSC